MRGYYGISENHYLLIMVLISHTTPLTDHTSLLLSGVILSANFSFLTVLQEFEIDEFSQEYLALHPMLATMKQPSLVEEHFEAVTDDDNFSDADGQSSEDEHADGKSMTGKRVPR